MSYGKDGWEARMDITERLRETEIAENTNISHIDRWPIAIIQKFGTVLKR